MIMYLAVTICIQICIWQNNKSLLFNIITYACCDHCNYYNCIGVEIGCRIWPYTCMLYLSFNAFSSVCTGVLDINPNLVRGLELCVVRVNTEGSTVFSET